MTIIGSFLNFFFFAHSVIWRRSRFDLLIRSRFILLFYSYEGTRLGSPFAYVESQVSTL